MKRVNIHLHLTLKTRARCIVCVCLCTYLIFAHLNMPFAMVKLPISCCCTCSRKGSREGMVGWNRELPPGPTRQVSSPRRKTYSKKIHFRRTLLSHLNIRYHLNYRFCRIKYKVNWFAIRMTLQKSAVIFINDVFFWKKSITLSKPEKKMFVEQIYR